MPFILLLVVMFYFSFTVDESYNVFIIFASVVLVLLYIFSPQIDWWWYRRYPPELEKPFRQMLRQQMLDEVERMRREEEENWRDSNLTYRSSEESRIVWGYDPKADRDMRNQVDLGSLPGDRTRPATLFRAQF